MTGFIAKILQLFAHSGPNDFPRDEIPQIKFDAPESQPLGDLGREGLGKETVCSKYYSNLRAIRRNPTGHVTAEHTPTRRGACALKRI